MHRFVFAVLALLVLASSAMAGKPVSPEQLAGKWTYTQTVSNDVYVDPVVLEMGGDGLTGVMPYMDGDKPKQDVFSHFVVQKTGRIDFVTKRPDGKVARHRGEPSADGNTIRGNYDLGFGVGGRFVLNRAGVKGPPVLSGRWTYTILDPSGGPGVSGDVLLLGDVAGGFEGYLHYNNIDTSPKKVEGTVAGDGTVAFSIYEKKTMVHSGKLTKDGLLIEGGWGEGRPDDGRFTMKKAVR